MSYGSIQSRYFREYCDSFTERIDIFSKLNASQLKLMRNYYQWASSIEYKKVRATNKIGSGYIFYGLLNNLLCKDATCEVVKEQLSYIVQDIHGSKKEISLDSIGTVGISDTDRRVINNISEEILTELEYMCYIKDNNFTEEFEDDNYGKLKLILDKMYSSNKVSEESEIYYCFNILMAKLPLPQNLIEYYKKELSSLYKDAINQEIIEELLIEYKYANDRKEFIANINNSSSHLLKVINSYVKDDIELEKKRAVLKLAVKFESVYEKLSNNGKTDFVRIVEASKQTAFYITTALGERLATKKEIKSLVSGVYKKDTYFLTKEKRDLLLLFGWTITGDDKYYLMSSIERYTENFERLEKNYKEIWKALAWLGSSEFLTEDIKELGKGLKAIEYPDEAEDEVKEGSLVDRLKYIKENANEDNSYEKIALDIAQKCIKYKKYSISEKQLYIVNTVYESLNAKETNIDKVETSLKDGKPNLYSAELITRLQEVVKHPLFNKSSFPAKIIDSVVRFKKCSEKQYTIIEEEMSRLRIGDADPMKVFGFGSQEIGTDTNGGTKKNTENNFFIDDEDDEDEDEEKPILNRPGFGGITGLSDLLGSGGTTEVI